MALESRDAGVTSTPTEAEIGRVRRHAVADGGAALQLPHKTREGVIREGRLKTPRRVELTSCGEIAQFTVPLERQEWQGIISAKSMGVLASQGGEDETPIQAEANGSKFCVVDDAAHLWPRFQNR